MNFRLVAYWLVCTTVAFTASGYLVGGKAEAADVLQAGLETVNARAVIPFQIEGVPELGRAILLFFGIFAVAYTYQQAWKNFRSSPAEQKR
jgi:hypothetical protein